MNPDTFVYFTQLFNEFQHYNPVILFDVNLTSSRLRTEQSEVITCFQYTNISVHKLSVCFLSKKKPTFPHAIESSNVDRREGIDICF